MVTLALLVQLEAKPRKESEFEIFLSGCPSWVQEEQAPTAAFAIRLGPSTFGNFDAFPDEVGLKAKACELFAQPLTIEQVDVLAARPPA